MRLAGLIFDVDGTLAETEEAHRQAFNEIFAAEGVPWFWDRPTYKVLLRTTGGKERMLAYQEMVAPHVAPLAADRIAALHVLKTARYGEILAGGGLSLRPGVRELVAEARAAGVRLAVATTTNRPNVDALCRCCWGAEAAEVFDVIAAGDEVRAKKPAPDVFVLALDRLGLQADACLAFEDSANGVRSARGAGLRVVVTPSAYTEDEDFTGADYIRPTLAALSLAELSASAVAAP